MMPVLRRKDGCWLLHRPFKAPNLVRNGIDLAFETDPLYLDVNNPSWRKKKNKPPQYEMDVNGTTKTTNLIATTATIYDINSPKIILLVLQVTI